MAVFRNEPEEWQRLDWAILQNGYACLYHRPEFLQLDVMWFRKERYRVIEFDCAKWETDQLMHDELKQLSTRDGTLDVRWSKCQRLLRTLERVALVHNLDQVADEDTLARYKALVAAEEGTLGPVRLSQP